jgi:hypothetical protein
VQLSSYQSPSLGYAGQPRALTGPPKNASFWFTTHHAPTFEPSGAVPYRPCALFDWFAANVYLRAMPVSAARRGRGAAARTWSSTRPPAGRMRRQACCRATMCCMRAVSGGAARRDAHARVLDLNLRRLRLLAGNRRLRPLVSRAAATHPPQGPARARTHCSSSVTMCVHGLAPSALFGRNIVLLSPSAPGEYVLL